MRKIGKIGLRIALIFVFVFSGIGVFPLAPAAEAQSLNEVNLNLFTAYNYHVSGDNFINGEVSGDKVWGSGLNNSKDSTGLPVSATALKLDSSLNFEGVYPAPAVVGPPTYEWSFGDVPEGKDIGVKAGPGTGIPPAPFTPGFDASRSADKTEFSASGNQTLTIAVTPRQALPNLNVNVRLDKQDKNVIPTIISPATDEAKGIYVADDGQNLSINLQSPVVGSTYTYEVVVEVVLREGVSQVQFLPFVGVKWGEGIASGAASGSSLSRSMPEVGTWTWSAQGSYAWQWWEDLYRSVGFQSYSRGPAVNSAVALFNTFWVYPLSGDSFTNSEVTGNKSWQAQIINLPDETGKPVTNAVLSLDSTLAFDRVVPTPITPGPPTYRWSLGDVGEWETYGASVHFIPDPVTFTPGFDASRSVDRTVFSEPASQSVTIKVTPREEGVGLLLVDVFANEDDKILPTITSYSGHDFAFVHRAGRHVLLVKQAPLADTEYSFTVNIGVSPKVPQVEFMPRVRVYTPGFDTTGTTFGSSVTYAVPEVGTWTWSADGSYEWMWLEGVAKAVVFVGYSNNTPTGTSVEVAVDGASITFGEVTTGGDTAITPNYTGPEIPTLYQLGTPPTYFDLTTTAIYVPPVTVSIDYSGIQFETEDQLRLWQWNGTDWVDITTSIDTQNNLIYGQTSSLSVFTIVEPNQPPIATVRVTPYLAPVGSVFAFDGSASSDPDGTIVSYSWDFGDGSGDSGISVTHTYANPGLYNVALTVTDDIGARSTDSVMVVVYNPAAGFATGGGWLIPGGSTSELGDMLPGLDSTSPANFGFVVKYKPGATTPEGQLEFQYRQGDFNLHSTGMDWLVIVNNNWAKFRGIATIKGLDGLFPFRVDARDGDFGGGNQPDRFIIKIWAPGTDPDKAEPIYKASGDLQGGSIIIHTK